METLTDTTDFGIRRDQLQSECEVVMGLIRNVIEDNAQKAMDRAEYEKKYARHYSRYEKTGQRMVAIEELRLERNAKRTKMVMFLDWLTGCGKLLLRGDGQRRKKELGNAEKLSPQLRAGTGLCGSGEGFRSSKGPFP